MNHSAIGTLRRASFAVHGRTVEAPGPSDSVWGSRLEVTRFQRRFQLHGVRILAHIHQVTPIRSRSLTCYLSGVSVSPISHRGLLAAWVSGGLSERVGGLAE